LTVDRVYWPADSMTDPSNPPQPSRFSRIVRNGKVIYVPATDTTSDADNPPSEPAAQTRPANIILKGAIAWGIAWVGRSLVPLGLLGGLGGASILSWFSWQLISNPDMNFWVNQFLPGELNQTIPLSDRPRTLDQILESFNETPFSAGPTTVLAVEFGLNRDLNGARDVLVPRLRQRTEEDCAQNCNAIQELLVYRSLQIPKVLRILQPKANFRLLDQMRVGGPSEADLIRQAAYAARTSESGGSSQPMPLSQLEILDQDAYPGRWLVLSGLKSQSSATAAYGQVIYFTPRESKLSLMLNWTSSNGTFPQWQNVTGSAKPELLIDQSVGLEPLFQVYQVQRAESGVLLVRPIALNRPVLEAPTLSNGLRLAQVGLWTPALQMLSQVKRDRPDQWNAAAQAQWDLVRLHAQRTQAQASQPAANGLDQIQAYLINGDWQTAWTFLRANPSLYADLYGLLAADEGALGDRIKTAQNLRPTSYVIAWSALLRQVQSDRNRAQVWVQAQSQPSELRQQTLQTMKAIEQARNPK
jgi:hypothetical protein